MTRCRDIVRTASALLLGALLLAGTPAPVTLARSASSTCRVRNVTQDTHGTTLKAMVAAAHDGDSLRVRGTCRGAVIGKDLVIRGVDDQAVLTGRDRYRVLRIKSGATVTVRNLRIVHGSGVAADRGGGGIWNGGTLTLVDSIVSHSAAADEYTGGGIDNRGAMTIRDTIVRRNKADGGWGGGIANFGTLVVVDSRVTANMSAQGGGIYNLSGTLTIRDSTVSANTAAGGSGGGVSNIAGTVTMQDSTVRDNAAGSGGGIDSRGAVSQVTLIGSRVTGNRAYDGAGISNARGTVTMADSTVSANTAQGSGGGIFNRQGGTVTLDSTSSVTGNSPDDCVGTSAC